MPTTTRRWPAVLVCAAVWVSFVRGGNDDALVPDAVPGSEANAVSVGRCPSECYGHGKCMQEGTADPYCVCDDGFHGATCSGSVRPVKLPSAHCPSHCSGHGVCSLDTKKCKCDPGFEGANCGTVSADNICTSLNRCSGQGDCVKDASGAHVCECGDGFTGDDCSTVVDLCNCRHGKCVIDAEGQPACECYRGFEGQQCTEYEASTDPCGAPLLGFCSGQGLCTSDSVGTGLSCMCGANATGARCDRVVVGCPGGCSGRGGCDPVAGSCECEPGLGGPDCSVDLCADPSGNSSATPLPACSEQGVCERVMNRQAREAALLPGVKLGIDAFTTSELGSTTAVAGLAVRIVGWKLCTGMQRAIRAAKKLKSAPFYASVQVQEQPSAVDFGYWVDEAAEGLRRMMNGISVPAQANQSCPVVTVGSSLYLGGVVEIEALVERLLDARHECVCDEGWKGKRCDAKDMAVWSLCPRLCSGHGRCRVVQGTNVTGACDCGPGWEGSGCEKRVRPKWCCRGGGSAVGVTEDCSGNGKCTEDLEAGTCMCECMPGYLGAACNMPAEEDASADQTNSTNSTGDDD